jgi:hypothetical protein
VRPALKGLTDDDSAGGAHEPREFAQRLLRRHQSVVPRRTPVIETDEERTLLLRRGAP